MVNTDMNTVELIDSTNYNLKDCYSTGYTAPDEDTTLGGTQDLKNVEYSVDSSGNGVLKFTRALITGDKYDKNIAIDQTQNIILAWGSGTINYHGNNYKSSSMKISKGGDTPVVNKFDFFAFHGIILIILWVAFNFVGYISSRFLKHQSWWVWLHWGGSGTTAFISIGVLAASIKYSSPISPQSSEVRKLHKILGIILFSFIILQTLLGSIEYFLIYLRKVEKGTIHKVKQAHKYIGISLTFIVYISIITGFIIKWDNLVAIPAVLCGVFLNIIIILEILNMVAHYFKKIDYIQDLVTETSRSGKNLKAINLQDLNNEKSSKTYVLYENYLCDVGGYVENHPGGSNLLADNLYQDIGRYVTGTQAYSKNFHQHAHNYMTHKHIIAQLAYAEIRDNHGIVSLSENTQILERQKINNMFNYICEENCFLSSKNIIAENVMEFQFNVDKFNFARILPNVSWIGRHFSVSSRKINKTRYYSLCLCLNPLIKEKHLALIRNIHQLEKQEQINEINLSEKEMKSNYLCLYIKKYPFKGGMSRHIHELPVNSKSDLIIRGPNGVGLNLFENRLEGIHVIFGGGTGVIPFIDLVAFTLRYAVHKISSKHFNNNLNVLLPNEADSFNEIVSDNFQLHFYVSFRDRNSSLFLDVCEELAALDNKYNLNIFKLHAAINSEKNEIWDDKFISSHLELIKTNIKQIYVVGPIPFMDDIRESLIKSEIAAKEKIFLV